MVMLVVVGGTTVVDEVAHSVNDMTSATERHAVKYGGGTQRGTKRGNGKDMGKGARIGEGLSMEKACANSKDRGRRGEWVTSAREEERGEERRGCHEICRQGSTLDRRLGKVVGERTEAREGGSTGRVELFWCGNRGPNDVPVGETLLTASTRLLNGAQRGPRMRRGAKG